jgi:tetratricopeptide (TPR) repeat protein
VRKNGIVLLIIMVLHLWGITVFASGKDFKQLALREFKGGNYRKAIQYLKEAQQEFPNDPEVYYYLGYFTHFLCYDSVPLAGYSLDKSDQVLGYLKRAVELKTDYGNAYYFIGTEYGVRARIRMMKGDIEGAREEYRLGRFLGGYPGWLVEYGRNTLKSCEKGAILFLGGDADTNPVNYLQLVEGYRTDVTAMPMALMSRPWYIKIIKGGVKGIIPPVPISWSDYQIMNMHPYKWKTNRVSAPISDKVRNKYDLEENFFYWEMRPDISENRLSAAAAAVADVIVNNGFERPVYFSLACAGVRDFEKNLQLCGFARRLIPFDVSGTEFEVDTSIAESVLLHRANYQFLPGVLERDMPRVSGVLRNYPGALLVLCRYYMERDRKREIESVLEFMDNTGLDKYIHMESLEPYFEKYRKLMVE